MFDVLASLLLGSSALGLLILAIQHLALRRHVRTPAPRTLHRPGISLLKPLCGADDELEANLASFAALEYPDCEVLLGLRSTADPAWPIACEAARRWPHRFRVVLQQGDPGLNPKVNQLITLLGAARHELFVISDSNVRVRPDYLDGIAAGLADPSVGLVTHPLVGVGARRIGSLFDSLHLAGSVSPGMVAAQMLAGQNVVVGKSMAMRRSDLELVGGFEVVRNVLAEDYVLGVIVARALDKRVVVATSPIENVTLERGLGDFMARYCRWSVLQRNLVGLPLYAAQVLLNPVLLVAAAIASAPRPAAVAFGLLVACAKTALDAASGAVLRPGTFRLRALLVIPLKDLAFGVAWLHGLVSSEVNWRGNRLRVLPGTRLALPDAGASDRSSAA